MAKDLFIKAINLLNINLDIDDNTFNKLTENEQKITVYFSHQEQTATKSKTDLS